MHQKLKTSGDNFIAYHKHNGKRKSPIIIFLGGYMSNMNGTKALYLENFCKENDYSFIRFDYFGHGESSGEFADGTITIWLSNILAIIDKLTDDEDIILIGSSLGGWLMILAALERKNRIKGLLGIASAPDFTEELIWQELDDEAKNILTSGEIYYFESEYSEDKYPMKYQFIEDAKKYLILQDKIDLTCPVRLIHGMEDNDVPCSYSERLSELLTTKNLSLTLIPNTDHRVSSDNDLATIEENLNDLLK